MPFCTKLQLLGEDKNNKSIILSHSSNNELLISPTNERKNYIVEVVGWESCTYEISYTTRDDKVYELVSGHPFSSYFKPGEQIYFLHMNNRNDSFRVVAMVDHGFVSLRAKNIDQTRLSEISDMIDKAK